MPSFDTLRILSPTAWLQGGWKQDPLATLTGLTREEKPEDVCAQFTTLSGRPLLLSPVEVRLATRHLTEAVRVIHGASLPDAAQIASSTSQLSLLDEAAMLLNGRRQAGMADLSQPREVPADPVVSLLRRSREAPAARTFVASLSRHASEGGPLWGI